MLQDTKETSEDGAKDEGYEEETITDKSDETSEKSEKVAEEKEEVNEEQEKANGDDEKVIEDKEKVDGEPMDEGVFKKPLVPAKKGSSSAAVDAEMSDVVVSNEHKQGWDAVRDVYKRASMTHCTRKAVIRMKWAQFEETIENIEEAREILRQLVEKYPMLLGKGPFKKIILNFHSILEASMIFSKYSRRVFETKC